MVQRITIRLTTLDQLQLTRRNRAHHPTCVYQTEVRNNKCQAQVLSLPTATQLMTSALCLNLEKSFAMLSDPNWKAAQ